ncbi:unnamed protein product [Prorocentrum cordatum]|uniref:Cilia- and flagella-associated protein 157 n=1 Tax=Prorocentrum cordatum TaxID=2364126 RepID=A0ABN9WTJ9_9DINO|nr:unnamed protein product [Polarella glacialis]
MGDMSMQGGAARLTIAPAGAAHRPRSEKPSKARQAVLLEEIESAISSEREYWSSFYLEEVRKVERSVSAAQHRADADRADAEALRASVRDLRGEHESSSAVGATRLSLLEAAVSELREAWQEEREQLRGELRRVEERGLAEAAALRASHEGALSAAVREALQIERVQRRDELREVEERGLAEVAALRAAHEGALGAAVRDGGGGLAAEALAELMSEVSQLRAAAAEGPEEACRRLRQLSEGLEQVRSSADAAHQRLSELALGQAKVCERLSLLDDTQAHVLAAQGKSRGDLLQAEQAVEELRAALRGLAAAPEEGARCAGPDGRAQDVDLRAEVASLRASSVEQVHLEGLRADGAARGDPEGPRVVELRADVAAEQRAASPRAAPTAGEGGHPAGPLSARSPAHARAVCERVAELENRMAAASSAPGRREGPLAPPAQEALPTLLTSGGHGVRRPGAGRADAKPSGAQREADSAAADVEVARSVPSGLKAAAAVPLLRLPGAVRALPTPPLSASGPRPQADQPRSARCPRPQSLAAPAAAPQRLPSFGSAQAAPRHAVVPRGGSAHVAPGPPLLLRRV